MVLMAKRGNELGIRNFESNHTTTPWAKMKMIDFFDSCNVMKVEIKSFFSNLCRICLVIQARTKGPIDFFTVVM